MKISIIIPCYNIAEYIEETLRSIKEQTFSDYEVILIDDGSTDNTFQVIRNFIESIGVNNFYLSTQQNQGVSSARIKGLSLAKGEWVMFVDGDDKLLPNALEALFNHSGGCNIIHGSYYLWDGQNSKIPQKLKAVGTYTSEEYISLCLQGKINSTPWAKLYKRNILNEDLIRLPREIKNKEDVIMNMRIACEQCGNVCIINDPVYLYRWARPNSALTNYSQNIDLNYEIRIWQYLIEPLISHNLYDKYLKDVAAFYFRALWSIRSKFFNLEKDMLNILLPMSKLMWKYSFIETTMLKDLTKRIFISIALCYTKLK